MQIRVLIVLSSCLLALSLISCGGDPAPGPVAMGAAELEQWEIALVEWRIEKNEDFMDAEKSPLPAGLLDGFEGLDYYFPAAEFRFRLPLVKTASQDTVMLTKRKGDQVPYVVVGQLRFNHDNQDHALTVYGPVQEGADYLFLPFYDLTNGETTYPGGRYVDLDLADDGTVEVDFNKAYSPLCAYDTEAWNCTLPPAENRLPVRVVAGEKILAGSHH